MRIIYLFLTVCFILIFPIFLFSQNTIQAVYVDTPPRIDGRVNDGIWQKVSKVNQFFQTEPNTGEPASRKTEFYVCYDKDNIYIAARIFDDPQLIAAQQLERDASLSYDDKIAFWFDTFLDQRNAYWFQMNARGCIGDGILNQNGAALNKNWDGLWEGKASIHEEGWDAEISIPFKTLNFHPTQDTWGIKFMRELQRRTEKDYWPVANVNGYKFQVSDAGLLTGLTGISQGIGLDIRPYGLAGMDRSKNKNHELTADAGLDVFYQITPGIKSALTVNTDFAQTEVDDRQINLTRFPLFFPEKRDFFLDGAGYFHFGREGDRENSRAEMLIPFFSRRFGLDNDRNPIPIITGTKITGQSGPWNLGVMDVIDKRGDTHNNFAVSRISRNMGSQSMIGIIGTSGNATASASNSVFGMDVRLATTTFQGNKNFSILLYGLKSFTKNISGNDYAFGLEFNYPNDFFNFRTGFNQIENNFNAGVGFVPRKDIRNSYLEARLGPRPQKWGILQMLFITNLDYISDINNVLLSRDISFRPLGLRFNAGEEFSYQVGHQYELLSEEDVISSIIVKPNIYKFWRQGLMFSTAQRRNLWILLNYDWGGFWDGNRKTTKVESGYKINVPLFVGLALEYNEGTLSGINFTREVYRIKGNILFSPTITLNNFFQYDNFTKTLGWQSRFRWILKPGNEVNLVWNSISVDPFERFEITESTTKIKFQYNYRF